jgi:transcriptional repressor NrdR
LSALTVEKSSGNSEKFEEKLVRGFSRAGTPFMLAKDISKSITSKLMCHDNNFLRSIKLMSINTTLDYYL